MTNRWIDFATRFVLLLATLIGLCIWWSHTRVRTDLQEEDLQSLMAGFTCFSIFVGAGLIIVCWGNRDLIMGIAGIEPPSSPYLCVCRGCDIRYALGTNCVITTLEEAMGRYEEMGQGMMMAGSMPRGVPDRIGLHLGGSSWLSGTVPTPAKRALPKPVRMALKRGEARSWCCAACESVQPYSWCEPKDEEDDESAEEDQPKQEPGSKKRILYCATCKKRFAVKNDAKKTPHCPHCKTQLVKPPKS